jgi:hypothetical protein
MQEKIKSINQRYLKGRIKYNVAQIKKNKAN